MIRRAKAAGLPFGAVLCDSLYGRSSQFRYELHEEHLLYLADIPNNLRVYLEQPIVGLPVPQPGKKGRKPEQPQVLNNVRSYSVKQVGLAEDTYWLVYFLHDQDFSTLVLTPPGSASARRPPAGQ